MAGPEKRTESAFAAWCKLTGLICLKLIGSGWVGFPDRTVLMPGGRIAFVEFKSPTGTTSPSQDRVIRVLRNYGFKVLVTSDKQEAIDFVKGMLE
jgi:hypothetical protein